MCAMCSSAAIPLRSWWTGQLMAKVPTARMFTLEARQAISCAAARMDAGGTLSTIIKGRQCESPPDIYAPPIPLALREGSFPQTPDYPLGQRQLHTEMPSKTIDVDGLKIFCREGGTPGRGKTRNLRR